ncbi:MAG: hypothetical protein ACR2OU_17985 [Thermomicrobiales bacterium]
MAVEVHAALALFLDVVVWWKWVGLLAHGCLQSGQPCQGHRVDPNSVVVVGHHLPFGDGEGFRQPPQLIELTRTWWPPPVI